jgi:transposase
LMSVQRFVGGSREQVFLLPPDMREWLPDDHLVWVVVEAVERLDLSAFVRVYRGDGSGRPAYDPALMVALLLYGYATGERSSRVLERRCREDVALRVICAGVCPDHVTIARFRRRHGEALIGLFAQVLLLCRLAGLGRLGTIAIDGTKVRANASKERYRLERQAEEMLAEADARDAAEDELEPGAQEALRGEGGVGGASERRARFAQAAEALASEQTPAAERPQPASARKQPGRKRGGRLAAARKRGPNLTDPESRVMKSGQLFVQGYNAQLAVSDDHLVVACELTNEATDHRQLTAMVEAVRAQIGDAEPCEFLADAGYWLGEAIESLHANGERVLVPPNGRPPQRPGPTRRPAATAMRATLADPAVARRYRRRQAVVEPVIAHIKHHRRLDRFLLRGLGGARLEWALGCTAHNLTRLARAA